MATLKISLGAVLATAVMMMVLSVLGVLVTTRTIISAGNVNAVGVGLYWDSSCNSEVSSIEWGALDPGETMEVTIYIQNEGSIAVVLTLTTDNWNPASASNYITLSWNRENYVLNPGGSVISAVLTLSVSPDISGITNFSHEITITGTEQT